MHIWWTRRLERGWWWGRLQRGSCALDGRRGSESDREGPSCGTRACGPGRIRIESVRAARKRVWVRRRPELRHGCRLVQAKIVTLERVCSVRSRSLTFAFFARVDFFECESIVFAVGVGIPPFPAFDREADAHEQLALVKLVLEVFELDSETEAIPAFVARGGRRDMADVSARNFRYSSATSAIRSATVWQRLTASDPL